MRVPWPPHNPLANIGQPALQMLLTAPHRPNRPTRIHRRTHLLPPPQHLVPPHAALRPGLPTGPRMRLLHVLLPLFLSDSRLVDRMVDPDAVTVRRHYRVGFHAARAGGGWALEDRGGAGEVLFRTLLALDGDAHEELGGGGAAD